MDHIATLLKGVQLLWVVNAYFLRGKHLVLTLISIKFMQQHTCNKLMKLERLSCGIRINKFFFSTFVYSFLECECFSIWNGIIFISNNQINFKFGSVLITENTKYTLLMTSWWIYKEYGTTISNNCHNFCTPKYNYGDLVRQFCMMCQVVKLATMLV